MFNQPLWERTLLQGVSIAPPGSRLRFSSPGSVQATRYWAPPPPEAAVPVDEDEGIERLIHVLKEAQARAMPDDATVAFPITGGLDSRINLALNQDRWSRSVFLHTGFEGRAETPISRQLASEFGLPLEVYPGEKSWRGVTSLDPSIESGELNAWQWWLRWTHQEVAHSRPDAVLLDGYLQDTLFNPHIVRPGLPEEKIKGHLAGARFRAELAGAAPSPGLFRELEDRFRAEYAAPGGSGLALEQRFYLENRSRKYVLGTARLAQDLMRVALPGVDNDVLDFAFSLPWEQRAGGPLYRGAIRRLSEKMAGVACDKTGVPLFAEKPRPKRRESLSNALRYYTKRLVPRLSDALFSDFNPGRILREDPKSAHTLERSITRSAFLEELLGGKKTVQRVWRRFLGGHETTAFLLGLFTIARLESAIQGSTTDDNE